MNFPSPDLSAPATSTPPHPLCFHTRCCSDVSQISFDNEHGSVRSEMRQQLLYLTHIGFISSVWFGCFLIILSSLCNPVIYTERKQDAHSVSSHDLLTFLTGTLRRCWEEVAIRVNFPFKALGKDRTRESMTNVSNGFCVM